MRIIRSRCEDEFPKNWNFMKLHAMFGITLRKVSGTAHLKFDYSDISSMSKRSHRSIMSNIWSFFAETITIGMAMECWWIQSRQVYLRTHLGAICRLYKEIYYLRLICTLFNCDQSNMLIHFRLNVDSFRWCYQMHDAHSRKLSNPIVLTLAILNNWSCLSQFTLPVDPIHTKNSKKINHLAHRHIVMRYNYWCFLISGKFFEYLNWEFCAS